MNEINQLYDYLIDCSIATSDEISLVTSIIGYSLDSLESILYSRTGYRSLDQITKTES